MKSIVFASLLLMGGVVHADYLCVNHDKATSLKIQENHVTPFGDTLISLSGVAGESQLFGKIQSVDGLMLKKSVIELHPYVGDSLTIVSKPLFCGRGSCDTDFTLLKGSLKIGDILTTFSCSETLN